MRAWVRAAASSIRSLGIPASIDNDIALIKLARKPNATYKTITIPTAEYADILERPNTETIVTGWGRTEAGTPSRELREGRIEILDRNICNAALLAGPMKAAAAFVRGAICSAIDQIEGRESVAARVSSR